MADHEQSGDRLGSVNIRPGTAILSVLKYLNYQPWYALAEFVDNAVQSYTRNRGILERGGRLRVDIDVESSSPTRIRIRDNAAGIAAADFPRAFRPAAIPPDRAGLSEFGMGMKSAACWFAPRWQVRTQAAGESVVRSVSFDVAKIVDDAVEELAIEERRGRAGDHFTEVILDEPFHLPMGRTVGKIKEHLTDIYRCFSRDGTLDLRFNGDPLVYADPAVLVAPYERNLAAGPKTWRKEILFDFGQGMAVSGFAALMERGSFARSGFALFRRGRLIEGSGEDGYRPPLIFSSSSGSYRRLRLFGELHLTGFEVSHTKDGFRWDENEEPFLELLRSHLDGDPLPLLKQADAFRALAAKRDRAMAATQALDRAADAMEGMSDVLPQVAEADLVGTDTSPLPTGGAMLAQRELHLTFRDQPWIVQVELSDDASESQWISISDQPAANARPQVLQIRMAMAHPFMVRFAQTDTDDIEALIRVAAALALGEVLARHGGVRQAGTVRRNLNEILREALSRR